MELRVNVRIEHEASDKEYEDLHEDLQSHYKGNSHVNQVHIAAFASDKSHVTTKQAYTYHYKHEEKETINRH